MQKRQFHNESSIQLPYRSEHMTRGAELSISLYNEHWNLIDDRLFSELTWTSEFFFVYPVALWTLKGAEGHAIREEKRIVYLQRYRSRAGGGERRLRSRRRT